MDRRWVGDFLGSSLRIEILEGEMELFPVMPSVEPERLYLNQSTASIRVAMHGFVSPGVHRLTHVLSLLHSDP